MNDPRRSFVQRASTYRSPERNPDCALCGERIREWESLSVIEHESFGGVALPVHDECGAEQADAPESGR